MAEASQLHMLLAQLSQMPVIQFGQRQLPLQCNGSGKPCSLLGWTVAIKSLLVWLKKDQGSDVFSRKRAVSHSSVIKVKYKLAKVCLHQDSLKMEHFLGWNNCNSNCSSQGCAYFGTQPVNFKVNTLQDCSPFGFISHYQEKIISTSEALWYSVAWTVSHRNGPGYLCSAGIWQLHWTPCTERVHWWADPQLEEMLILPTAPVELMTVYMG